MISSKRRSLEEYKSQTLKYDLLKDKSSANIYAKYYDEPIVPETVFIMNYGRNLDHTFIESLAKKLTDKKVYCSFIFRNNFSDCSHVNFVKKNSEEFFACLATAQYIVVDKELSPYYVPKKGQCVITSLNLMNSDSLAERIYWTNTIMKSDIVTISNGSPETKILDYFSNPSVFSGTYVMPEELADIINSGKTDFLTASSAKKKIAIAAQFEFTEKWFPTLQNYLEHVDFDLTDITLIIDAKQLHSMERFLNMLDSRVKIVSRKGWFLISEDLRKTYDYFNTDLPYFDEPDKIYDYVSKDIYTREFKRSIGHQDFDCLLLFGDRLCSKNYWLNIGRALAIPEKHIIFDETFYVSTAKNADAEKILPKTATGLYLSFDKIWFWGTSQQNKFYDYMEKYNYTCPSDKFGLISLLESKHSYPDSKIITLNEQTCIAYNEYWEDDFCLDVVPIIETADFSYGLLIERDSDYNNLNDIKEFAKSHADSIIYVLDLSDIAKSTFQSFTDEFKNVFYYSGAMYYYVLMDYINTFIVSSDNEPRINELNLANKNILFTLN